MTTMIDTLKQLYWTRREHFANWRRHHRPSAIRHRAALRLRAWRQPVIEIAGVKLYRSPGYTIPILETLDAKQYEMPEARIVRHAIDPDDSVLELGTGLGFLAAMCAQVVGSDKVHTYEANPALAPVIARNFRLNGVSPRHETTLLGEEEGEITFYLMNDFWSSSTIRRHPKARPIQVPMKRFNDVMAHLNPSFLLIDIEGGEQDFIRYARLDGVRKIRIELHPRVIGQEAVAAVEAYFIAQGFHEDPAVSDPEHKLYRRPLAH